MHTIHKKVENVSDSAGGVEMGPTGEDSHVLGPRRQLPPTSLAWGQDLGGPLKSLTPRALILLWNLLSKHNAYTKAAPFTS